MMKEVFIVAKIDAKEMRKQYLEGVDHFSETFPEIASQYNHFTGSCFENGEISVAHKHLSALAISIKDADETCIVYHMDQCIHHRCTEKQIKETLAVAAAFGGGAAMSSAVTTGLEAYSQLKEDK